GVRGGANQVVNCHLHHLGGGGVKYWGGGLVEGTHIHDIGLVSANCIGIMGGGVKSVIRRNVIHDTPYSGMSVGGTETLIEENLLYRCMQVHHDGAAIYMGGGKKCIIRRNLARDMVQVGSGYGVSAYYLDEKCQDCVVAENVAINIPHPSQNHMTLNCELRDNVFLSEGDMTIAFSRCSGQKVMGNKFHLTGKLNVRQPDAITEWRDNLIFTRGDAGGTVLEDVPRKLFKPRQKPRYLNAKRIATPPVIDGRMGEGEWPEGGTSLRERANQRRVRGAPTSVKILVDDNSLYILVNIVAMFPDQRKLGTEWGRDEGVELAIQGRVGEKRTLYVLRGFTDGTLRTGGEGGATAVQSAEFAEKISYGAGVEKKLWRAEWAVPFSALGVKADEKTLVSFNLTAYRSEDDVFAQYAGTLGETWDLKLGGRLMLNWKPGGVGAGALPTFPVITIDTPPGKGVWPGGTMRLAQTPEAAPLSGPPCSANVVRRGGDLLVRVTVPTSSVTKGSSWRTDDGAEVCIRGKTADGKSVVWVIHGFAGGAYELSDEAGASAAANAAL
ncbi:MAG: right-handed parallel beta-helix repeat-containing protein, partial [Lentisphaeria bacterium]|nr:right-handed parallel beta-helix repeat-containing protein [Lentisphaeria bacterium]